METLRQLIFRDLDDGWSQDTDDTPTNETANERSPFTDGQQLEQAEPTNADCPSQWEAEETDAPPPPMDSPTVKVMRKGKKRYKHLDLGCYNKMMVLLLCVIFFSFFLVC